VELDDLAQSFPPLFVLVQLLVHVREVDARAAQPALLSVVGRGDFGLLAVVRVVPGGEVGGGVSGGVLACGQLELMSWLQSGQLAVGGKRGTTLALGRGAVAERVHGR
jgi:hypothetical protein